MKFSNLELSKRFTTFMVSPAFLSIMGYLCDIFDITISGFNFEKMQKNCYFDKTLLIKIIGSPDGHGVNIKVVDIDKIYPNMENEQYPESHF